MELLNERWFPVLGYEGRYEVSDFGRVRSLTRYRRGKAGALVPVTGRIMQLTQKKRSTDGRTLPYVEVKLRDGSPRNVPCRSFLVHRLVAQAFVGELFDGCHVDHIDGDHANNHYQNLRILSSREHYLLHPCIRDPIRNARMQDAAQAKIAALRATGEIIGRLRVRNKENC